MGFRRRDKRPPPGEYPESFTRAFVRWTLPSATPAQARSTVEHLRRKGWSEVKLAEYVLPFMPPDVDLAPRTARGIALDPGSAPAQGSGLSGPAEVSVPAEFSLPAEVSVPAQVPDGWLDRQLPTMTPKQIRLVVEELERRAWATRDVAMAVLPHLLPKLRVEDADAILAGLREMGVSEDDLVRAKGMPA
jgi:hypothetical protein